MNTIMNNRLRKETKQLFETTGLTMQEVADEYNLDIGVINKWGKDYKWNKLKEYEVQRNSNYKYTQEFKNRIKHTYKTTILTYEEIASKYNVNCNLIFRWSKEGNWTRFPKYRRKN